MPDQESTISEKQPPSPVKKTPFWPRFKWLLITVAYVPFRYIFGRDIFISYSRADATKYAEGLRREVRALAENKKSGDAELADNKESGDVALAEKRKKEKKKKKTRIPSFYLDRLNAPAGDKPDELPRSLVRHLMWSNFMVVICSENAVKEDSFVLKEIEHFPKANRKIIPISIGDTFLKIKTKEPWNKIGGASDIESPDALDTGTPSKVIIQRILDVAQENSQELRLKRATWGALALIILSLSGFGAAVWYSISTVDAANQKAFNAETNANTAVHLQLSAEANRDVAVGKQRNAEANANAAIVEQNKAQANANTATKLAEEKNRLAQEANLKARKASELAKKKTNEAKNASLEAKTQGEIADGNLRISNSFTASQSGNAYQSLTEATKGFTVLKKHSENLSVAYKALRGGLRMNGFRVDHEIKDLNGVVATSLSPDATRIIVCSNDDKIEILNSENLDNLVTIPFADAKLVTEISTDNSGEIVTVKLRKEPLHSEIRVLNRKISNTDWKTIKLPPEDSYYHIRTFAAHPNREHLAVGVVSVPYPKTARSSKIYLLDINEPDKITSIQEFASQQIFSIAFSPDGTRLAVLTKSDAFFAINPFHVYLYKLNGANIDNSKSADSIVIYDEFLFGDSESKILLNDSGHFILFSDRAGRVYESNNGIPVSSFVQVSLQMISGSYINNNEIISLEKQCHSTKCTKEDEDLSNTLFAPFFLRKRRVSDLDLSVTAKGEIRMDKGIDAFDIDFDKFAQNGIIRLKARSGHKERGLEWRPCKDFSHENVFPCESDSGLRELDYKSSRTLAPAGRLELKGDDIYVHTPSGKKYLIRHKFLEGPAPITDAKLTFSPDEEILIINYFRQDHYFIRQNSEFIKIAATLESIEKNPIISNTGLIAVFHDEGDMSPRNTSNPKSLIVWDMKSRGFNFTQPLDITIDALQFSPDGKFLVGVSYDLLASGGGSGDHPYVYRLKLYLWLVDPDKLLDMAERRIQLMS